MAVVPAKARASVRGGGALARVLEGYVVTRKTRQGMRGEGVLCIRQRSNATFDGGLIETTATAAVVLYSISASLTQSLCMTPRQHSGFRSPSP